MLPDMVLSAQSAPAAFIGGRSFPVQKHIDYELGPIAIRDATRGLMHQIWRARMENQYVYLSAPNVPEFILLDLPKVTEISFSFDQNANPIFAYVQDDIAKLYWFDSAANAYTTTVFGADVLSPRVTLDDKRLTQRAVSDVLLFYQRDNKLMMRMQRERFSIEHTLASGVTDGLVKCGMMRNLRLGIQLVQYHPAVNV